MNLTIALIRQAPRLAATGLFEPVTHLHNRYRDIVVPDPVNWYGVPIYEGTALEVGRFLAPGTYRFEWADSDTTPEFWD